jgi:hypothetical protein
MKNALKVAWAALVIVFYALLVGAVVGALVIGYRLVTSLVPGAR